MSLIGLLVAILVLGLVYWAATRLLAAFGVGEPIRTVVIVVLVIVFVLWILGAVSTTPLIHLR